MLVNKRFYQVASLVGAVASCLAACQPQTATPATSEPAMASSSMASDTASELITGTFQDISGKTYDLASLRGKKVYIKFWASWCSICLAGLKDVDQLAQEAGPDVVILSMIAPEVRNEKPLADFSKWFAGLDYQHLPVLVDEAGAFMKQVGVVAYPTSAFIDSQGHLVKVQTGHLDSQAIKDQLATMP